MTKALESALLAVARMKGGGVVDPRTWVRELEALQRATREAESGEPSPGPHDRPEA